MKPSRVSTRVLTAPLLAALMFPVAAMAGGGDKFESMDSNGDGYLDQNEITQKYEQKFDEMDADGDGNVTEEEWANHMQEKKRSMGDRMKSWVGMDDDKKQKMMDKHKQKFERHDENGNGVVSRDEFMSAHQQMMQKADMDGDGRISQQEFEQMHKDMKMKGKDGKHQHMDEDESRMLDQRKQREMEQDSTTGAGGY